MSRSSRVLKTKKESKKTEGVKQTARGAAASTRSKTLPSSQKTHRNRIEKQSPVLLKSRKLETPHAEATLSARTQANSLHDSRQVLLDAATQVFASKGFDGTTIQDLAVASGMNVSAVSYYFGGKDGLYRACLESFGSDRVEASERLLKPATSRKEFELKLRLFADEFTEFHLGHSDVIKLISRAIDFPDSNSTGIFKRVFFRIFGALRSFLLEAQRSGFLREELDVEITTLMMFGSFMHVMRTQELADKLGHPNIKDPDYRRRFVEAWVDTYVRSTLIPDSPLSTDHRSQNS